MKTKQQLRDQINDIINSMNPFEETERTLKKARRRISFLYQCSLYLETNPNESFVDSQLKQCLNKLAVIHDRFPTWYQNNPAMQNVPNPRTIYNREMNVRQIKTQAATLAFILK